MFELEHPEPQSSPALRAGGDCGSGSWRGQRAGQRDAIVSLRVRSKCCQTSFCVVLKCTHDRLRAKTMKGIKGMSRRRVLHPRAMFGALSCHMVSAINVSLAIVRCSVPSVVVKVPLSYIRLPRQKEAVAISGRARLLEGASCFLVAQIPHHLCARSRAHRCAWSVHRQHTRAGAHQVALSLVARQGRSRA